MIYHRKGKDILPLRMRSHVRFGTTVMTFKPIKDSDSRVFPISFFPSSEGVNVQLALISAKLFEDNFLHQYLRS